MKCTILPYSRMFDPQILPADGLAFVILPNVELHYGGINF